MKKIFIAFLLFFVIADVAVGQDVDSIFVLKQQLADVSERLDALEQIVLEKRRDDELKKIWGKGRYTNISYGVNANSSQDGFKFNGDWSFALTKGTSYMFPSKPFFNMLKVGFDVRWFDITATKYKSNPNYVGSGSFLPDYSDYWDDYYDDYYDDYWDDDYDIGHYDINIGAFGIGPVVSVAPFSGFKNGLRYLKATLYFHYQPTIGLHLLSEDGEVEVSTGYCGMLDFGGKIGWRGIAFGVEGRWGSSNYSSLVDDDSWDYDYDYDYGYESSSKIKRKLNSTRIYISFTF